MPLREESKSHGKDSLSLLCLNPPVCNKKNLLLVIGSGKGKWIGDWQKRSNELLVEAELKVSDFHKNSLFSFYEEISNLPKEPISVELKIDRKDDSILSSELVTKKRKDAI
jgi:hypothetical protein